MGLPRMSRPLSGGTELVSVMRPLTPRATSARSTARVDARNGVPGAGIVWALAASVKYLPAVLFLHCAVRGKWRAVAFGCATLAAVHLLSGVVLGFGVVERYLSGGLDSCAVLGVAAQYSSRPLQAFTLSFDEGRYDERAIAEEMAAKRFPRCGANPRALSRRSTARSGGQHFRIALSSRRT